MKNNFWQRTLTGFIYVIAVVCCTLFSAYSFFILLLIANFFCMKEFYELVLPDKSWIEKYLGIIAGSVIFIMFAFTFSSHLSLAWYYHLIPVIMLIFIIKLFEKTHNEFETLAFQVLGIVYITLPLVMLSKMGFFNSFEYSPGIPLGFFFLVWTSDTGAYLTGRQFGKHKLFERVSPKKTWEGSVGGLVLTLLASYGVSFVFDDVNKMDWLIIAVLIVIFGTFGDLFESLLKRNLRIKDSGDLLPGHGGVLDRFDAVFFAVSAVFFYLLLTN